MPVGQDVQVDEPELAYVPTAQVVQLDALLNE